MQDYLFVLQISSTRQISRGSASISGNTKKPGTLSRESLKGIEKEYDWNWAEIARRPDITDAVTQKYRKKHTISAITPLTYNPLKCRLIRYIHPPVLWKNDF
ncbi:MAG TPA: hypothetical protein VJ969_06960 [Desulfopila sp.]|nr:hypothetical protein [Desulfopila sp.]